jgi:hypothetical protein
MNPSEGGLFGALDGQPITLRDATDFFLVDPNDPVDVAIASLSAGLLVFPPAAAAATLARYGWKGKKAFEKLAEAQKRFAPSSTDTGIINAAKRRVVPDLESIEGGLDLIPGARAGAFEINRALGEAGKFAFDPEARSEMSDSMSDISDQVSDIGDNFDPITDLAGQLYDQRFGETVGETFGGIADLGRLTPLGQLYEQGEKYGVGEKIRAAGGKLYDQTFGESSPEEATVQKDNNPPSEQTLGQRINNPFNIRSSSSNDWQGADDSIGEGGYQGFQNNDYGIRAADRVLNNYGKKQFEEGSENFNLYGENVDTLRETLNMYAPPSENPTESYVDFISDKTGIDPDAPIDLTDAGIRSLIMSPMATFESRSSYSPEEISASINRANEANDESILDSVASGEYVADNGIADVARSIAEARGMKSATFKRGDKDLAAVTAEELEESGFDSLKDYLNNMQFNEESGRYAPQEMSRGGIMRLKDGSDPDGVEKEIIPKDIQGVLNEYNLSLEEFLKFKDEKKQAYLKSYQDGLDLKRSLVDPRLNPAAGGVAAILDTANSVLEAPSNIYEAAKYSDLGRVMGFSDPDQERPDDDPSFSEDIERIRGAQAPSLSEVNALIPEPVVEGEPEVVEEEPGIIQKALGAVGKIAGFDLPENERRAMLAAAGRRKYGVSRAQAYENSMFNQAKIADMQATTAARGTSETQKGLEYLKELFPDKSDEVLVDLLFQKGKNKVTNSELAEAIQKEAENIRTTFAENNSQSDMTDDNADRAKKGLPPLRREEWIIQAAKRSVYSFYNIQDPNVAVASSVAASIGTDGKKIT